MSSQFGSNLPHSPCMLPVRLHIPMTRRDDVIRYSVRTDVWRYTEWVAFDHVEGVPDWVGGPVITLCFYPLSHPLVFLSSFFFCVRNTDGGKAHPISIISLFCSTNNPSQFVLTYNITMTHNHDAGHGGVLSCTTILRA